MSAENDQKQRDKISLTRTFTAELKGRQSVRATFRLTQGCITAISIIANQMGIKQKSLFDYLAEDKKILESIAQEIKNMTLDMHNGIPKTFVINRKSLSLIDEISKNCNVTKDALVELSIQRLFPLIHGEREKHENRKAFLVEINRHYQEGEKMLYNIRKQLGDDDPIIKEYEMVMSGYETSKNNMEAFIERSKGIEKFDSNEEGT